MLLRTDHDFVFFIQLSHPDLFHDIYDNRHGFRRSSESSGCMDTEAHKLDEPFPHWSSSEGLLATGSRKSHPQPQRSAAAYRVSNTHSGASKTLFDFGVPFPDNQRPSLVLLQYTSDNNLCTSPVSSRKTQPPKLAGCPHDHNAWPAFHL